MKIEFKTSKYIASHGKQPRGRAQWAFRVTFSTLTTDVERGPWFYDGTLTAAKKAVAKMVGIVAPTILGATHAKVEVLP